MVSIKLKSDGSSTYEEILSKIELLKNRFCLGYNSVSAMESELLKINEYVDESIYLNENEKIKLNTKVNNLKKELQILNKERNLPYTRAINTIKLIEEDFLEDYFWNPTPEELEQSYLRVLNILNNNELTNKEKVMLKDFVLQKISEIPKLVEKRIEEEKKYKAEKKVAISNARQRYKNQNFFTKFAQTFITKNSLKNMNENFEFMDIDAINELYRQKTK